MRRLMLLAPLLLLTACFASKAPLVSAANASWPIKDGAIVTAHSNCAVASETEEKCQGRREGYVEEGKTRFTVTAAGYLATEIPPKPKSDGHKDEIALFKDIGGGDYLMQVPLELDERRPFKAMYVLMRFDGNIAYLHAPMCEKEGKDLVREGLLKESGFFGVCEVGDLEKLATIFRRKVAAGSLPVSKWVIEP